MEPVADSTGTLLSDSARDPRFVDPAWTSNRYFRTLRLSYDLAAKAAGRAADALPLPAEDRRTVRSLTRLIADALAPPNALLGNPTALRKAARTRGRSLLRGAAHAIDDLQHNGGLPSLVDRTAFTVGRDLAITPGRVVFRNSLMELIQYEPRTATVYSIPLLCCPPWVNKFYIADLTPGRSFVRWALDHGHTVFMISYRNPQASQRDVGYDCYLRNSLLPALAAVRDITGAEEVNLFGACLGGLSALMLAAWSADTDRPRVRSVTALSTLTDFTDIRSEFGTGGTGWLLRVLGLPLMETLTYTRGVLSGRSLEVFFRLLRSDELIWSRMRASWLSGEAAPAYDILYWNCDTLSVPHRAQQFLLRNLCLDNAFARGTAELAGRRLDPDQVTQDLFVVAAHDDHLVPWTSAYRTVGLFPGDVRFHLASGGHIAAVLASPDSGASYWSGGPTGATDPEAWLAGATKYHDTWWRAWARWLADRAGSQRTPPPLGSHRHPAAEPAPGPYVLT
ncbi:polyhydroxyalkanoate synthase [Nocardia tenerifensis]|uniref:Polyhydroxyalkanoate synthase n=1 Tax=Nocardia tenerifensis TaxID=228006 RepID=A0A318KG23_9NOCA|nr:alpha/beta fold hydrolase [Nocardia tenerifensis]PXX71779.1 polyhydroxyalkanoate synthase [Nocardia tenerifensis]